MVLRRHHITPLEGATRLINLSMEFVNIHLAEEELLSSADLQQVKEFTNLMLESHTILDHFIQSLESGH